MTLPSARGGRAALVPRIMPRRAETALKRLAGLACRGRADQALCTFRQGVPWRSAGAASNGGPMPGGDEIRDVQRAAWAGLSAGWEKWDSVIMDQLGPVGTAMIGRLDIADDQRHLDVA